MTRWSAADVQKANARVRKAKHPLRVTQEDFDKLEAIQQDVERIGKEDRARRKRLGIKDKRETPVVEQDYGPGGFDSPNPVPKRKPTPVLVPINNVLHIGGHRYTWWHWRQAYCCPCGMWVSEKVLERLRG